MTPRFLLYLGITAYLLVSGAAKAACTGPAGIEGEQFYNADHKVMQFCDGTNWWAMKNQGLPSCPEGDTIIMASAGWSCGNAGGGALSGPSGCANIGDLCADGTVFAGYHPITQAHLFIATTDQERPGSPGFFTMPWKISGGTDDISPDSDSDGQANHANRGGAIGDFMAFQACEDLSFGGQSDWYLPSRVELYYIWSVRGTIEAGGNITNFQNTIYWTSTEPSTSNAWNQNFTSGGQVNGGKTNSWRVRCVRRD
ncbi:MAG: DUF1566 domain-containing protein [Hyphomicrobiales bacterium]|nr:DUF1566 domain-containing protein [Hyphomicrobiales bacterium]